MLLFVGRFLGFKRVPLLVRAYARARSRFTTPAPLVIWGGSPGEWEGEHPHTVAVEEGVADDVLFIGWRGHDELPQGLACADAMVAPSVDEPFGQVFLEAMACKIPVVTTATGGPLSFVNTDKDRPNGWLVAPDDEAALADALVELVADDDERQGADATPTSRCGAGYSWRVLADRFADCYADRAQRAPVQLERQALHEPAVALELGRRTRWAPGSVAIGGDADRGDEHARRAGGEER